MRYIMRRSCLFLVMIAVIVFTGCGQKKKEDPVNDDGTLKVDYSDDDDYYTFHCVKSDSE